VLPECLRLSKVPAVHCSIVKSRVSLKSRIKTTLPTSGPAEKPLIRKRNSRSMCADFAAHGRSRLSSRESHWFAPVPLAAVQPGPWLRPATTYSPYRIGGEDRRDQATEQPSRNKNTNELRDQPNPRQSEKRGRRSQLRCACIVGVDNHQPSLVTSVSTDCHTKPK
jgi:hypothetical protein